MFEYADASVVFREPLHACLRSRDSSERLQGRREEARRPSRILLLRHAESATDASDRLPNRWIRSRASISSSSAADHWTCGALPEAGPVSLPDFGGRAPRSPPATASLGELPDVQPDSKTTGLESLREPDHDRLVAAVVAEEDVKSPILRHEPLRRMVGSNLSEPLPSPITSACPASGGYSCLPSPSQPHPNKVEEAISGARLLIRATTLEPDGEGPGTDGECRQPARSRRRRGRRRPTALGKLGALEGDDPLRRHTANATEEDETPPSMSIVMTKQCPRGRRCRARRSRSA